MYTSISSNTLLLRIQGHESKIDSIQKVPENLYTQLILQFKNIGVLGDEPPSEPGYTNDST